MDAIFPLGLVDPAQFDFRPKPDSPLVDAGRVIEGFTDDYKSQAPDIGAYEFGAAPWKAGHRDSLWILSEENEAKCDKVTRFSVRMSMPPLKDVSVMILPERAKTDTDPGQTVTFTPTNWMQPQVVELPVDTSCDLRDSDQLTTGFSVDRDDQVKTIQFGQIDPLWGNRIIYE